MQTCVKYGVTSCVQVFCEVCFEVCCESLRQTSHHTCTDDHDNGNGLRANHDNDDNCGHAGVSGGHGDDDWSHGHAHEMIICDSMDGNPGRRNERGKLAKML